MALALSLVLQATPLPLDFDLSRLRPVDFDLRSLRGTECLPSRDSTIVVCGRRATPGYPLEEMARIFATRPVVAETRLFANVRGRAYLESAGGERGAVANRVMFGIKMPF